MKSLILQIACPDQTGIVAKVTKVLFEVGGNIVSLEQHVEAAELFFMRIKVDLPEERAAEALEQLNSLANALGAELTWRDVKVPINVALLVSQEPHCLIDLLARHEAGELDCQIPLVISNHESLAALVGRYNIPFHYMPIDPANPLTQEQQILELLRAHNVDLAVLVRYMKILSAGFVGQYEKRIINIHHSFLPAFKGNRPYHQAWERGVKVIGATAHYATARLDEGPIIAQDVEAVSHHHSPQSLAEAGREIEQRVLAAAVKAWLEYRIIVHNQRTIIFHSE